MQWQDLSGELHRIMAHQKQALDELADEVRAAPLVDARVFRLPEVVPEEELIEPDLIEPVMIQGAAARDEGLAGYERFHTGEGLSTRVVWRLPGVIAVTTDRPQSMVDRIEHINSLRRAFAEVALSVANEDERYDLIHHAFPGMVYLQVVRQLRVVQGPIQSVTFSWGRKAASQQISLESADAKLEWAGRHAPPALLQRTGLSANRLRECVAREREALATLPPDTQVRWRRLLRVRPLMNIRVPASDGQPASVLQREANTPLLLLNAPSVRLRPMRPFDARKRSTRQPRSDQGQHGTPLSRVLPLFLVEG